MGTRKAEDKLADGDGEREETISMDENRHPVGGVLHSTRMAGWGGWRGCWVSERGTYQRGRYWPAQIGLVGYLNVWLFDFAGGGILGESFGKHKQRLGFRMLQSLVVGG